jgi:radical SAM superfamily enzyme YgiQ (UPF0313 family)
MTVSERAPIRVLLTKPPVGKYPLGYDLYPPMIPMGLGFLARVLRDHSIPYLVCDQYLASYKSRTWDKAAYVRSLSDYRPTHVCLSSMSVEWPEAVEVIRATRKVLPNCEVLVGGPHAHFAPDEISSFADWVVVGEGERALPDILLRKLKLQYVRDNIVEYPFIQNLDSLIVGPDGQREMIPWDDFSPLSYDLCMPEWGLDRKPVVNFNTSRGCPFSCKFCSILGPWGRGFRYFSASVVVNEIEHLQDTYGVRGVCFREDNFTVLRRRVEEVCRLLLNRGLQIDWAAEARVDSLDRPLAELMSSSGCKGLLFGVESGSERMLKAMKKGITTEDTRRAFSLCKEHGIRTYCSIVYGLPGELPEDREVTRAFIQEIEPDFLEESVYLGIPGSAYYSELRHTGSYEFFDPTTLHIYPHGFKELYSELFGGSAGVLPY